MAAARPAQATGPPGAVRENVDTIRGLPPPALRVSTRLRRGALQASLLVALPVLRLVAYNPLSGSAPDRAAVLATAPAVLTFRAPKAIGPVTASLGVKKLVLDPGHGGNDSGARAQGVWEKEITLDIARELGPSLKRAKYDVADDPGRRHLRLAPAAGASSRTRSGRTCSCRST